MEKILKLMEFDFRRLWTIPLIIFVSAISLIVVVIMILPIALNWFQVRDIIANLNFASTLKDFFNFIVPMLAIIFSAGMVSFDVRNYWLRTLMSRDVSRAEYLTSRVFSAAISIFFLMLLLGTIPIAMLGIFTDLTIEFNFWNVLLVHLFYLLNALLYLYIGAFLSCWLPSFVNAFVMIFWLLINTLVLPSLVSFFLWDLTWAVIMQDFFFPSGLSESIATIISGAGFPTQDILWGLAGLFGFAGLAYWNITIIKIDKGSE